MDCVVICLSVSYCGIYWFETCVSLCYGRHNFGAAIFFVWDLRSCKRDWHQHSWPELSLKYQRTVHAVRLYRV